MAEFFFFADVVIFFMLSKSLHSIKNQFTIDLKVKKREKKYELGVYFLKEFKGKYIYFFESFRFIKSFHRFFVSLKSRYVN